MSELVTLPMQMAPMEGPDPQAGLGPEGNVGTLDLTPEDSIFFSELGKTTLAEMGGEEEISFGTHDDDEPTEEIDPHSTEGDT